MPRYTAGSERTAEVAAQALLAIGRAEYWQLSTKWIAREMNLSTSAVRASVKRSSGRPISAWLDRRRRALIEDACTQQPTITQAARMLGTERARALRCTAERLGVDIDSLLAVPSPN